MLLRAQETQFSLVSAINHCLLMLGKSNIVTQIKKEYADKVKLLYRDHFSLSILMSSFKKKII